ncbi:hypothetical protein MBLNU457_g1069t1 [Dothideomycetes sp. NU457]
MAPIPRTTPDTMDETLHDLDRLLKRLDHGLLSDDADASLLHSPYHRKRIGANVEYARTLLLRLEHDASTIKITSQRQALNTSIQTKRDLIKRLNRRLLELDSHDDDEDDDNTSSDEDPSPNQSYAPARPDAHANAGSEINTNPSEPMLRSRQAGTTQATDTATTTSSLFAGRRSSPSRSLSNRETLLSSDRQTQEQISSSLVSLAQALKATTMQIGAQIEGGKSTVDRAAEGLDKNVLGMEGAERRMGTLRRMTEGQGWYGRIKLYAIIAALWVGAFLLVFVGPKLRF